MKYSNIFKDRINCLNSDDVFKYLIDTLKDTIHGWGYYVNWDKVFKDIRDVEISLNIMNCLIGKDDIENEYSYLLKQYPSIASVIPILIAERQSDFKILDQYSLDSFKVRHCSFVPKTVLTDDEIADIVEFSKNVGLLDILRSKKIKNLVDYVIGVEVGLDTNGRKNRSGTEMETIVETFIRDICKKNNYAYIKQATALNVRKTWNMDMAVDKSSRRIDFALNNKKRLYLIETNFYNVGGSKLKSTAGEYKSAHDLWKKGGHTFIWITDGMGWHSTKLPLQETFSYIDYVLNLEMVSLKLLEDIINGNL
ncbi:type II restriction endonuclease [Candidatus Magnetominusculus xianensis]|uniref:Type-2 restriction enzyme n=1 Tax=Candidatus Magnetominusculus xianensis TaxID=1748249 RepID=A0ABR5SBN9_9BACT|nr:type II restriction endonuclease [Candidatus Magnetominusculus xianensis]KWT78208.1 type II restriction endonuclease [Candidatus Magnetominusculus xianensis]MBF0402840.1 type II restriction endonuclease [Nitrospirota bacterium]